MSITISMTNCNFKTIPAITTSLYGFSWHADITGHDNIYIYSDSGHNQFSVYLRKGSTTVDYIKNKMNAKLRWIAIGNL